MQRRATRREDPAESTWRLTLVFSCGFCGFQMCLCMVLQNLVQFFHVPVKLKLWNGWNCGMLETEIKIFISLTLPNNYSKMRCFIYRCAFSLSYHGPCYRVRWRWWMECQWWWLDLDHVLNDPFAWWPRNCAWRSCLFFGSIFIAMPPSNLTDLSSYRLT